MIIFAIKVVLQAVTFSGANGNEVKGPVNTVSVAGSQVTLTCVSASGNCSDVEWLKTNPDASHSTVYRGDGNGEIRGSYKDRYSVENSNGCHLVIKDVQLVDAGRFTCRVFHSRNSVENYAYLVVLQTEPKCSINTSLNETLDGDGVQMTCEVTYNGTDGASMVWKDVEDIPAVVVKNKTIRRSYSAVASAPEVPPFTCITSFQVTMATGAATNIPSTTCKTPVIKIMYSVRDVKLSPSLSNYYPGTVITCTAEGWPSPTFQWQLQKMENDGIWMDIQNQTSDVFAVSAATSRLYRCVAMNVVNDKSYNDTSQEFQVNKADANVIPIALGVTFGVLLPTCIILIVICFCLGDCPGYHWLHSETY